MAINPQTTTLLNLDYKPFTDLVIALEINEGWRKVAEFVKIFNQNEIMALSLTIRPAESLLNKLGTKLWPLHDFINILKECSLYDALLVISKPEPMQIILQPTNVLKGKNELTMNIGNPFELEFGVTGIPPPKFQWFKDDQILEEQTHSILRYERYKPEMEGEYFCNATQDGNVGVIEQFYSDTIKIVTLPFCELIEKPDECVYFHEGSAVILTLKVIGYPKPNFEWLHENNVLENENKNVLFIKEATKNHSGEYRCYIKNKVTEITVKIKVVIYEENPIKVYKGPVSKKIALLIGNSNYKNLKNLNCPSNDVCTIANILHTLGFKTICLQNLELREIKIALELFADCIDEKCFAFFYYAGHGFTMGDKFLLPVDSPEVCNFKTIDAIPESMILHKIMNKNPVLFVLLLDMCLELPKKEKNPAIYKEVPCPYTFTPNRNLIKGYSTTNNLASYEREGNENGIYVNILKKYLGQNLPIFTVLGKVNEEISVICPAQMPDISHNTAQAFYLNNPIEGFNQDTNTNYYSLLDIQEEEIGMNIYLQKHKKIFNNAFDIIISNADSFEYCVNNDGINLEKIIKEEEISLRVSDLQKLGDRAFSLNLKVNGRDFKVERHFYIGNIFLDI